MVMPNIGYDQQEEIKDGVIHVTITLKTFLAKNDCWLGVPYKDNYILNHEQRHFDLVRLVAERFRRKATSDSLTVEDYNSILQLQYLKSFTEMNHLQDQYDAETHGGLDVAAQERWNRRIEEDLKRYGVR